MKRTIRSLVYYLLLPLITGLMTLAVAAPAYAEDCSTGDETDPQVSITSPTSTGVYETEEDTISLSGDVLEACGLQMVSWSIIGDAADIVSGQTDDWLEWSWQSGNIDLTEGENNIVVMAEDTAGNVGQASIVVTYDPPDEQSPPPIGETARLDPKKVKITFYFGGPSYEDLDRVSIVGYLVEEAGNAFVMPFDQDVTAIIHLQGVDEPVFTQTIPAGTISGTTKYRYTHSPPGIRELTFMRSTSTKTYLYLYIEKWNLLPDIRDDLTPEAYQDYVRSIGGFTLTLLIGPDKAWQGTAPLTTGTYGTHKQELVYNR